MPFTTLTSTELKLRLASGESLHLLDVRLKDDFDAFHLAQAKHNPVYEMGFVERLSDTISDRNSPVCVYGEHEDSFEARMAAEKMHRAGYTEIYELREGIRGWKDCGFETTSDSGLPEDPIAPINEVFALDLEQSKLGWTGRNLLNKHHGFVKIIEGTLTFQNGQLTETKIVADLREITCTDLDDNSGRGLLIQHLQDHDFFDTERHPLATFTLDIATRLPEVRGGGQNLHLSGNLELRGESHPISFEAAAGITPEGLPAAQARFSIDRTRWGVLYGSGKFFHRLAGHLVNDHIDLDLRIVTKRPTSD